MVVIVVIVVGYGSFLWIVIVFSLLFGFYGFIKKWVGG